MCCCQLLQIVWVEIHFISPNLCWKKRTNQSGVQKQVSNILKALLFHVSDHSLPCRATKWQIFSLFVFEDGSCFLCTQHLVPLQSLCRVRAPHLPTAKHFTKDRTECPSYQCSCERPEHFGRAGRTELSEDFEGTEGRNIQLEELESKRSGGVLILAVFNSQCGILPYIRLNTVVAADTVCIALRKWNGISAVCK